MAEKYSYNGEELDFSEYADVIGKNLGNVRKRLASASGKRNVALLAATKTVPAEIINETAKRYGLTLIGENKAQELLDKYPLLDRDRLKIHFIGHLQTNKVRYIFDKVEMIHSLDTVGLAKEIGKRCGQIGKIMPVLVEINIAGESEKSGVFPEDAEDFIKEVSEISGIAVKGLMTMAPAGCTTEEYENYFAEAKRIFEKIKKEDLPGVSMEILSMGMSDSYEAAARQGADIVRVGSSIFGKRIYPDKI